MKVRVGDLKHVDEFLQIRPVDQSWVAKYRETLRSSETDPFPRMLIDQDGQIIQGNHRFQAYLQELGEDHKVQVDRREFEGRKDRLEAFVEDNVRHGRPMVGFERKLAVHALLDAGIEKPKLATLFCTSMKKIESWAGHTVMVVGGKGGKVGVPMPVKNGVERLKTVSVEQYAEHKKGHVGAPVGLLARQICQHLRNGWVDLTNEKTVAVLLECSACIEDHLAGVGSASAAR